MQQRLEDLYRLQDLYMLQSFGQIYIDAKQPKTLPSQDSSQDSIQNCNLCDRSKISKPTIGVLNPKSKIIFVTQTPLTDEKGLFLQTRSAKMLQDIIQKVLYLRIQECSILSLLKCGNIFEYNNDVEVCKKYLFDQLKARPDALILCFLDLPALKIFGFKEDYLFGRFIKWNNQQIIFTHSLKTLSKNPSLKKETMTHLLMVKELL
ncbi:MULTISPECIES: uracil-DNA glycosylase family protein [unclassified Helicobacter]|uniref:uracil-DNA glycosylase family protein n=1 Tax=unclassified Helicobacter TaxID=2593540 RepID=UPI000CF0A85D|nr:MULTISPECIES: uracil-DNA glycosylase family protein [unclassified Helicobacter]